MARHTTRKDTIRSKSETIARRAARSCKYRGAARVTTAGRAR